MSYFNEDNVTEQMCINVADKSGFELRESIGAKDAVINSLINS